MKSPDFDRHLAATLRFEWSKGHFYGSAKQWAALYRQLGIAWEVLHWELPAHSEELGAIDLLQQVVHSHLKAAQKEAR